MGALSGKGHGAVRDTLPIHQYFERVVASGNNDREEDHRQLGTLSVVAGGERAPHLPGQETGLYHAWGANQSFGYSV